MMVWLCVCTCWLLLDVGGLFVCFCVGVFGWLFAV